MVELGGTLCDIIVQEYGVDTLLEKLSDPFWFHSFSLVTGFDWNSSGTTTATLAAIKEYYGKHDGAIRVIGGKGERMGRTSEEADAHNAAAEQRCPFFPCIMILEMIINYLKK